MINNYRDHAANERTFLAWVRTGVALMALGILVDKFHLFIDQMTAATTGGNAGSEADTSFDVVGVAMAAIGVTLIAAALYRFLKVKREIDKEGHFPFRGAMFFIVLAGLLIALGGALILYLLRII